MQIRSFYVVVLSLYLTDLASGLLLQKDAPAAEGDPVKKAMETQKAKEIMKEWRTKAWNEAKKSCDTGKLPATTDAMVYNICGKDAEHGRCVCNIAKAHSCHIGCRKAGASCPAQCKEKKCYQGDPKNGGQALSLGGHKGKCYKYCSQFFRGVRYCGEGPIYQSGLFVDCTGCNPGNRIIETPKEEKENWIKCVAGCFPKPTCREMCAAGTPECYAQCIAGYKKVVTPYWDVFKDSLKKVPLLAKKVPKEDEDADLVETGDEDAGGGKLNFFLHGGRNVLAGNRTGSHPVKAVTPARDLKTIENMNAVLRSSPHLHETLSKAASLGLT